MVVVLEERNERQNMPHLNRGNIVKITSYVGHQICT